MVKKKFKSFEGYKVYTDGSCDNVRTRIGGYAYLIIDDNGNEYARFSDSESKTTNNRMELRAITEAVKKIPEGSTVTIFTDSRYCITVLDHNGFEYEKNKDIIGDFRTTVKNLNLEYRFAWVKGHSGHEQNEIVDKMANEACASMGGVDIDFKRMRIDEEYRIREIFKAKVFSLIEDLFMDFVPIANKETIAKELSKEIDARFPVLPSVDR